MIFDTDILHSDNNTIKKVVRPLNNNQIIHKLNSLEIINPISLFLRLFFNNLRL